LVKRLLTTGYWVRLSQCFSGMPISFVHKKGPAKDGAFSLCAGNGLGGDDPGE
jgi:hypothetical protein